RNSVVDRNCDAAAAAPFSAGAGVAAVLALGLDGRDPSGTTFVFGVAARAKSANDGVGTTNVGASGTLTGSDGNSGTAICNESGNVIGDDGDTARAAGGSAGVTGDAGRSAGASSCAGSTGALVRSSSEPGATLAGRAPSLVAFLPAGASLNVAGARAGVDE